MQRTDFKESASGRLLRNERGYWAFVPNPLPPAIPASWELAAVTSQADRALSRLAGAGQNLPNPHLLIHPFMRREAVLSSRIEGTQASLADLLLFEGSKENLQRTPDVREVFNYVLALEQTRERMKKLPLSLRLIREMHARLLQGVRGERLTPGEFRRSQNWIGPPGCTLNEATFVPPPVTEMQHALGDLETYLHADSSFPPLIRLAMIHYQFEAIHPFLDGNGRIGRLLLVLLLELEGLLPLPLLYLSAYFERNRQEYYHHLLAVSQAGAWERWITFFLRGVTEQAQDALRRSQRLLDLRQQYTKRFQSARSSGLLQKLVDQLFSSPAISIGMAASVLGITWTAAQHHVRNLVLAGILKQVGSGKRNRLFMASKILAILEAPEA